MKITDAKVIVCCPSRNFVTLKIETDAGIYGLGDATLNGREKAVVAYLEEHCIPALLGRDPSQIEDIWQYFYRGAYWRRGPVTMTAISAIDVALWDIKGKALGTPLYNLLGGKSRPRRCARLRPRDGAGTSGTALEDVGRQLDSGFLAVRVQSGIPGLDDAYGVGRDGRFVQPPRVPGSRRNTGGTRQKYLALRSPALREGAGHVRRRARTCSTTSTIARSPIEAARLAPRPRTVSSLLARGPRRRRAAGRAAPRSKPFDDAARHRRGVQHRLRLHDDRHRATRRLPTNADRARRRDQPPSPKSRRSRRSTTMRTGFHGATDLSPITTAAATHFDLAVNNFGIQEYMPHAEVVHDVFKVNYRCEGGYLRVDDDAPGVGVDIDEERAKRYLSRCPAALPVNRTRSTVRSITGERWLAASNSCTSTRSTRAASARSTTSICALPIAEFIVLVGPSELRQVDDAPDDRRPP